MINYNKAFALPNEVWEDVRGYKGLYKVSSMGRVKSLKWGKERILRPVKDKDGYLEVTLYKDGQHKKFKVHRLVAEAFLGNPDNKPQINHLDEVKTSNHYSNLCWATPSENVNHGTRNKKVSKILTNRKDKSKPVVGIDPNTGEVVVEFPSTSEAGRNGYHSGDISSCCRGRLKRHHGLIWQYK